ncbi:hypothetical protein BH09BAC1_BH09BAC1_09470 [soil metagenome]
MENLKLTKQEIENLREEYRYSMDGYNYRDQLVPQEFANVLQSFSIYISIFIVLNVFGESSKIYLIIQVCLGVAGCFGIVSLLIDMQSNLSCKTALRERCKQIEDKLELTNEKLSYWHTVVHRIKYREERWWKGATGLVENSKNHGDIFVWATRGLLIIWVFVSIASIYVHIAQYYNTFEH